MRRGSLIFYNSVLMLIFHTPQRKSFYMRNFFLNSLFGGLKPRDSAMRFSSLFCKKNVPINTKQAIFPIFLFTLMLYLFLSQYLETSQHILSLNLSLKNGTFPSELKLSRVIPIHKGGKPDLCDNYRPIALLSSISKILEKLSLLN